MSEEVPFDVDDRVYKHGAGYSGPGVVIARFLAYDGSWRYVVSHIILGGHGVFYHIYARAQLTQREDDSMSSEGGDPNPASPDDEMMENPEWTITKLRDALKEETRLREQQVESAQRAWAERDHLQKLLKDNDRALHAAVTLLAYLGAKAS